MAWTWLGRGLRFHARRKRAGTDRKPRPSHVHAMVKGKLTTTFDKREDGFEKQFAHDEELKFKATARRNKMLGHWAARSP